MAANGSPETPTNETTDDSGYVLRQYLSGQQAAGDDDLKWEGPEGEDDVNDQDVDDQDYSGADDEQHVLKDEPGLEIEDEQNNAHSDMVTDDLGPDEQDPLDDDMNQGDTVADNGDEAELDESEGGLEDLSQVKDEPATPADPNIWTLPADRDTCTLEEIRRGQVINRVAPNECPVMGCGKKINEMRAEPSPGTIASGLRTHVLFVHYAMTCKRAPKKRKLAWSGKRRSSASPKKPFPMSQSNEIDYNIDPENFAMPSNDMHHPSLSGASLLHRGASLQTRGSPLGSILNKRAKQFPANNIHSQQQHQSSLQSLMQATGMGGFEPNNGSKFSPHPKQRGQDLSGGSQKNFNQTTSSLFSILAGLTHATQQAQQNQRSQHHHSSNQRANLSLTAASQTNTQRNTKPAHEANTLSLSQCSKSGDGNSFIHNQPINSSLLTLLNEKISGTVANSLQSQLQKSRDSNNEIPATANTRLNTHQGNNHYYQSNLSNNDNHDIYKNSGHNNNNNSNNHSLLSNLNMSNGNASQTNGQSSSFSLNQFIESIAKKTGSNIGPGGVAETKKIIEKFVTWLMHSSQTIADHYIAPYSGEAPQQKPEISASDVILAYKMMQKSQLQ